MVSYCRESANCGGVREVDGIREYAMHELSISLNTVDAVVEHATRQGFKRGNSGNPRNWNIVLYRATSAANRI